MDEKHVNMCGRKVEYDRASPRHLDLTLCFRVIAEWNTVRVQKNVVAENKVDDEGKGRTSCLQNDTVRMGERETPHSSVRPVSIDDASSSRFSNQTRVGAEASSVLQAVAA